MFVLSSLLKYLLDNLQNESSISIFQFLLVNCLSPFSSLETYRNWVIRYGGEEHLKAVKRGRRKRRRRKSFDAKFDRSSIARES
ncbi:unnamed protein product [Citrullus colocynthis]|uniref:Uncharacterized protein n=1 Tax=Citrullus colocynthis TaxID=252529 RepID=A0ABP0XRF7_9ROSI